MSEVSETHFGFKRITAENWQEPDVPRLFGLTTPNAWIEAHLQPQLSPNVPQEIASLFEVARGAMIYGWFFYPLITLGAVLPGSGSCGAQSMRTGGNSDEKTD